MHGLRVPPGPAGRPGETIVASSLPVYLGRFAPDGTRNDFRVLISQSSTAGAVCLGTVAERGDPLSASEFTKNHLEGLGLATFPTPFLETEFAGEPAITYEYLLRDGRRVVDFKVARDGWLFVAGLHLTRHETSVTESLGYEVLSTWEWLGGTIDSENIAYTAPATMTLSGSIEIRGSKDALWALLRRADLAGLVMKDVVRAFREPGSPRGIGERHYTEVQIPHGTVDFLFEIKAEQPPHELTFLQLIPRYGAVTTWRIHPVDGGALLQVEEHIPLAVGRDEDTVKRAARLSIDEVFRRIKALIESGWQPPPEA